MCHLNKSSLNHDKALKLSPFLSSTINESVKQTHKLGKLIHISDFRKKHLSFSNPVENKAFLFTMVQEVNFLMIES